jgi:hypothetical protein
MILSPVNGNVRMSPHEQGDVTSKREVKRVEERIALPGLRELRLKADLQPGAWRRCLADSF